MPAAQIQRSRMPRSKPEYDSTSGARSSTQGEKNASSPKSPSAASKPRPRPRKVHGSVSRWGGTASGGSSASASCEGGSLASGFSAIPHSGQTVVSPDGKSCLQNGHA